MLISQKKAAEELGVTKQALHEKIKKAQKAGKIIGFIKKNKSGVDKIDNEHPEWKMFKTNYAAKHAATEMKKRIIEVGKGTGKKTKKEEKQEGWEAEVLRAQEKLDEKDAKKKSRIIRITRLFHTVWENLIRKLRNYRKTPR